MVPLLLAPLLFCSLAWCGLRIADVPAIAGVAVDSALLL
jgi:hypothetical protein